MKSISEVKRSSLYVLFISNIILLVSFIGCREKEKNEIKNNKEQVVFEIHTSSDTAKINHYLRCYAYLRKPHFKDSGIMVYIANDDENSLKVDLSNEYDVNMDIFLNLNHDTVNQKWIDQYDFGKTAVFGKKFNTVGKDTLRGYILEYQYEDMSIDSVFKSGKIKKYYFEQEIYVEDGV